MGVGLGARASLDRPRQPDGALLERFREQMLATARRYSAGPHDAEDAYQRAAEIVLARQPTGTEEELCRWVRTTVKHEALAIRRQQRRTAPAGDAVGDREPAGPDISERAERSERLRLGAAGAGAAQAPGGPVPDPARPRLQLPRDLRGDRLDLHEGQPVDHRGTPRLHREGGQHRVRDGVPAAGAPPVGARRRRGRRLAARASCVPTCAPASPAVPGCASTARVASRVAALAPPAAAGGRARAARDRCAPSWSRSSAPPRTVPRRIGERAHADGRDGERAEGRRGGGIRGGAGGRRRGGRRPPVRTAGRGRQPGGRGPQGRRAAGPDGAAGLAHARPRRSWRRRPRPSSRAAPAPEPAPAPRRAAAPPPPQPAPAGQRVRARAGARARRRRRLPPPSPRPGGRAAAEAAEFAP